jgi:hypothetical protein
MASRYVTVDRQGPTPVARFDCTEDLNAFNQELARDLTEVARGWRACARRRSLASTPEAWPVRAPVSHGATTPRPWHPRPFAYSQ